MAEDALSERQQQVMTYVRAVLASRGYPPTMREIGAAVGLRSASSVHHQLDALQAKGLLRRDPLRSRTLELLPAGADRPPGPPPPAPPAGEGGGDAGPTGSTAGGDADSRPSGRAGGRTGGRAGGRRARAGSTMVPLVGRIAAGRPILADEAVEDVFALPRQLVGDGEMFTLRVVGDSMVEAAVCDGDFVVVRVQQVAESGEMVAAMIDGEATVKTYRLRDGRVWLEPRNGAYQPIDGERAEILGRVVAVLRSV